VRSMSMSRGMPGQCEPAQRGDMTDSHSCATDRRPLYQGAPRQQQRRPGQPHRFEMSFRKCNNYATGPVEVPTRVREPRAQGGQDEKQGLLIWEGEARQLSLSATQAIALFQYLRAVGCSTLDETGCTRLSFAI
jgi:hypothetical protein